MNIVGLITSVKLNKTFSPKNPPSEKEFKILFKEKPEVVKEKIRDWGKLLTSKKTEDK